VSTTYSNTDDQIAILQAQRATMAAIRDKDVESLSLLVADEFVYRTPGVGETSKADFLRNISAVPVRILSVVGEDLRVNVYGEIAVLTGIQHATFETSDGKTGSDTSAFTDVLAKRNGRWLLVLAHGVSLPQTDGDYLTLNAES
jgi:ketosteroid isomerase-like protein